MHNFQIDILRNLCCSYFSRFSKNFGIDFIYIVLQSTVSCYSAASLDRLLPKDSRQWDYSVCILKRQLEQLMKQKDRVTSRNKRSSENPKVDRNFRGHLDQFPTSILASWSSILCLNFFSDETTSLAPKTEHSIFRHVYSLHLLIGNSSCSSKNKLYNHSLQGKKCSSMCASSKSWIYNLRCKLYQV